MPFDSNQVNCFVRYIFVLLFTLSALFTLTKIGKKAQLPNNIHKYIYIYIIYIILYYYWVTKWSGILSFQKYRWAWEHYLREISHLEKDTYYMIALICGIKHTHIQIAHTYRKEIDSCQIQDVRCKVKWEKGVKYTTSSYKISNRDVIYN